MTTSSSNTSQQSTTSPGAAAQPIVQGITGALTPQIANSGLTPTESSSIQQLTNNGLAGDQFAPAETTNANTLLSGGGATAENPALTSNLSQLQSNIGQIAGAAPGSSTVNSPQVQAALQAANTSIANQVNGEFAAAGRSGSGYNTQALAQGEELADAPIILNQANTDAANQVTSANNLFNAGNTTANALTTNNQTALANEQAGTTAATNAIGAQNEGPTAAIEAQELGQSIPAQNLGLLSQIGIPLAGLNTTTSGTGTTNTTPSILQDITGLGGILGSAGGTTTGANGATTVSNGSGVLGLLGAL
jgi:hypothetical protein